MLEFTEREKQTLIRLLNESRAKMAEMQAQGLISDVLLDEWNTNELLLYKLEKK